VAQDDLDGAQRHYVHSLDVARSQDARLWELRTATSYAPLSMDLAVWKQPCMTSIIHSSPACAKAKWGRSWVLGSAGGLWLSSRCTLEAGSGTDASAAPDSRSARINCGAGDAPKCPIRGSRSNRPA